MISVKKFSATWCGPCKVLKPIFEEVTEEIPFKIISPQKLIEQTDYQFKYANPLDFTYSF